MSRISKSKLGSPVVVRFFVRLVIYYALFFGLLIGLAKFFPETKEYFPFGGAAHLSMGETLNGQNGASLMANYEGPVKTSLKLFFAIIGVLLIMLPVTWLYFKMRLKNKLDQSLIQTMLILPVGIAGVVAIVQNSLALAFSLAGIVAAVRFRNTLKNTGDSLFIFVAIGAGLAAGVRSLEIAIVMTLVFNFIFLILWDLDYGASGTENFMNPSDPEDPVEAKRSGPAGKNSG